MPVVIHSVNGKMSGNLLQYGDEVVIQNNNLRFAIKKEDIVSVQFMGKSRCRRRCM